MKGPAAEAWLALRLGGKRRRYLRRARAARAGLRPLAPVPPMAPGAVPVFACLRDEAERLPHWLDWHRRIGAGPFLIVDNGSTDGTTERLLAAPDVALWRAEGSYRAARYGMDWINGLLARHGAGRWCLVLDADELLLAPHHGARPVQALARALDGMGRRSMAALMLDLYPDGRVGAGTFAPGDDPLAALPLFDPTGYRGTRQRVLRNLWVQGGPRARAFFADAPRRAPTLNKLPLVRWRRGDVFVNSTHTALPRALNAVWEAPPGQAPRGAPVAALLHTKLLPQIVARSAVEAARAEHFADPPAMAGYYAALMAGPDLRHPGSARLEGWRQLERLGLMGRGAWA